MAKEILIIDDETDIRNLVGGLLTDEGFVPRQAHDSDTAFEEIDKRLPSLILLDIWLEGSRMDGLEILKRVRTNYPQTPVIMMSGHGNIETAVSAIRMGAYDFIEKPFKTDRLLLMMERALEKAALTRENTELRVRAGSFSVLEGQSSVIQTVRDAIEKAAPTGSRVLFSGPPGCGKEVAARLLHSQSKRAELPFVVLNCATMRSDDLEVALFGKEDDQNNIRKTGLLEKAHGGTLFLDEVADLPAETQAKIVRILQDQRFERVGGSKQVEVDVRFIASSNHDLLELMQAGKFREDLYYRLSVVPIRIPPLCERPEDIPLIAKSLMAYTASASGLRARDFGQDAIATMQTYDWPGNVRQLRNVIEWLLIMAKGSGTIKAEMLPPEITSASMAVLQLERGQEIMTLPLREAREVFEKEYLESQIRRFGGNISRTANFVGMERSALHRKLKNLNINSSDKG